MIVWTRRKMYWFLCSKTNYHKCSILKQHKFTILQSRYRSAGSCDLDLTSGSHLNQCQHGRSHLTLGVFLQPHWVVTEFKSQCLYDWHLNFLAGCPPNSLSTPRGCLQVLSMWPSTWQFNFSNPVRQSFFHVLQQNLTQYSYQNHD